jgi:hypothetical protein
MAGFGEPAASTSAARGALGPTRSGKTDGPCGGTIALERRTGMNGKVMAGIALAVVLVMPLAGCASSRGKISSARLCAHAGGTYSAQSHLCNAPPQSDRSASAQCQAGGGYYDPVADVCEVGLE